MPETAAYLEIPEAWVQARERRALVSENVADFMPLVHRLAARGDEHYGLVFSSPTSMPRGADTIGRFVEALDRLLRERPAEGALRNQVHRLRPSA